MVRAWRTCSGEDTEGHGLVQTEEESVSSPPSTYTEVTMMTEPNSYNSIQQERERL